MPEAELLDTEVHCFSLSVFVHVYISVSFFFLKHSILTQLSLSLYIFIVVKYI